MNHTTLRQIASFTVPPLAMKQALMACHPRSTSQEQLSEIALRHGGGTLLAQALELRLSLIGMIHAIDPDITTHPRAIPAEVLASILSGIKITVVNGSFSFDGDALAAQLRLASEGTENR